MDNAYLDFGHKRIRAKVIKDYIGADAKVVCFSCGNASQALIDEGMDVLCIGGYNGLLTPTRWFTKDEIAHYFSDRFDATSGHLSLELMAKLSVAYKEQLLKDENVNLQEDIYVPTGSGETIVCLKMAFPNTNFVAVYNLNEATQYNENAPLNKMVEKLIKDIIR